MKKLNIFLALPIAASIVVPAASCSKPIKQVEVTLKSEKELFTQPGQTTVVFEFSTEIPVIKQNVSFTTVDWKAPSPGPTKKIELDGQNLYFVVTFNAPFVPGAEYSFDLTLNVCGKANEFKGLKATYVEKNVPLPEEALIISSNNELQGLNPEFELAEYYTSLRVPERVTSIKENAFENAFVEGKSYITKIELNQKLTKIGEKAFKGCSSIATLDVENVPWYEEQCAISEIGPNAFIGWNAEGTIIYKDRTTYDMLDFALHDRGLGIGWFNDPYTRKMPKSDLTITDNVLVKPVWDKNSYPKHIEMIDKIIIPEGVTQIATDAFYDSVNNVERIPNTIDTISFPSSLASIGDRAFKFTKINKFMSNGNESEPTEICTFPDSLQSIGEEAFYCVPMTGVVFDAALKTIGAHAFAGTTTDKTPLAYINVEALTNVPEGWKSTGVFENISVIGDIMCNPIYVKSWKSYFMDYGIDFTSGWTISQYIDLLKEFTPSTKPLEPGESPNLTQAQALTKYVSAIDNPSILVDDLIFTLKEGIDASKFKDFKVFVSYSGVIDGTITFSLVYDVTLADGVEGYFGLVRVTVLWPEIQSCVVSKRPDGSEIMDFRFDLNKAFKTESFSSLLITETKYEGEEAGDRFSEYYDAETLPTTIDETTVGKVLSMVQWFELKDVESTKHLILPIKSHYLGKFNITD